MYKYYLSEELAFQILTSAHPQDLPNLLNNLEFYLNTLAMLNKLGHRFKRCELEDMLNESLVPYLQSAEASSSFV